MDLASGCKKSDLTFILTVGFLLLGMVLRVQYLLYRHSMNIDEASLALNVVGRSYPDLLKPLDYNQGAAPGFLVIQKAIVQTLGDHDYAHSVLPFICGLIGLLLMSQFAKIYASGTGVVVSLGIFVLSGQMLRYSSEAKQYSLDVCVALLLLILAARCLAPGSERKDFLVLGAASVLSLWLSHTTLFVMSAVFLVLLLDHGLKKDWQKLIWVGWGSLVWALNFGLLYFVSLRFLVANPSLVDYWADLYMPLPPWKDLGWFPRTYQAIWEHPVGLPLMGLGAALMLIGLLSLYFRNWKTALLLTLPFFSVLAASSLKIYPFGNRLILFLVPVVYLFLAEGIERIRLSLAKKSALGAGIVWAVLVAMMFSKPASIAIRNMAHPIPEVGIEPVLAYIQRYHKDGELIYVYYGAFQQFKYYAASYDLRGDDIYYGTASRNKPGKYRDELRKVAHQGSVWFLFAHNCDWCKVNEQEYFLEYLDRTGIRLREEIYPEGSAYHYRFEP